MSDIAFHPARRNQLLAQLPSREWERLLPYLEPVDMQRDAVLYNCAHSCDVYFPTSATSRFSISLKMARLLKSP